MKAIGVAAFIGLAFLAGSYVGKLIIKGANNIVANTLHHACGECDHVGECGDYECRPGVDGWKLKAGAR